MYPRKVTDRRKVPIPTYKIKTGVLLPHISHIPTMAKHVGFPTLVGKEVVNIFEPYFQELLLGPIWMDMVTQNCAWCDLQNVTFLYYTPYQRLRAIEPWNHRP